MTWYERVKLLFDVYEIQFKSSSHKVVERTSVSAFRTLLTDANGSIDYVSFTHFLSNLRESACTAAELCGRRRKEALIKSHVLVFCDTVPHFGSKERLGILSCVVECAIAVLFSR